MDFVRFSMVTGALTLVACNSGGPDGQDVAESCTTGIPTTVVDFEITGAEERSASFEIPCGQPDGAYGTLGQHNSPAEGDPRVLVIAFAEGPELWMVTVGANVDPVTTGETPVMLEGSPGFGRFGHGAFTIPMTADGDFYFATGGTVTIEAVDELDLGYLKYIVVSGSFDASFAHEDTGAIVDVTAEFTNFLAAAYLE